MQHSLTRTYLVRRCVYITNRHDMQLPNDWGKWSSGCVYITNRHDMQHTTLMPRPLGVAYTLQIGMICSNWLAEYNNFNAYQHGNNKENRSLCM